MEATEAKRRLKRAVAVRPKTEVAHQATGSRESPRMTDAARIERARRKLMRAVTKTAEALANGATEGSLQHIKLLLQLVGLEEGTLAPKEFRPKEKTLEEIMMERWNAEP